MGKWMLHWLEAEGSLSEWKNKIANEIEITERAVQDIVMTPHIDALIAHRSGQWVIPELGFCGYAYSPSMFLIACSPTNQHFEDSLTDGVVRRQVVHELHHCLRKAGTGYGRTLGDAIVTEGLAGRFVEYVLGTPPEPWEEAVVEVDLPEYLPDARTLWSENYNHPEWFFGTKSLPRWLGYSLGYWVVGRWLQESGPIGETEWVSVQARKVFEEAGLSQK